MNNRSLFVRRHITTNVRAQPGRISQDYPALLGRLSRHVAQRLPPEHWHPVEVTATDDYRTDFPEHTENVKVGSTFSFEFETYKGEKGNIDQTKLSDQKTLPAATTRDFSLQMTTTEASYDMTTTIIGSA